MKFVHQTVMMLLLTLAATSSTSTSTSTTIAFAFTPLSPSTTYKRKVVKVQVQAPVPVPPTTLYANQNNNDNGTSGGRGGGGVVADEEESDSDGGKTLKEINNMTKKVEQKQTAINRLKFQLNDLKSAAKESEEKELAALNKVDLLTRVKRDMDDSFEELQEQFSTEKEALNNKLRSTMDELNQVKVAQEQANDEKKSMMNGIVELQQQLSETNTMITKSKTEMNNISRDSALMVEQKIKELSSKDKEITQLMQEKNQYENDIQQLEMQSEKLKVALENSEQQKNQVQKMIDEIRKESEMTKKSNQENMNRLQNDLDVEREKFISQFAVLTEQLEQVKMETQEYVRNVSDQSMQEKEELQGTIADLQAELYQAKDRIDRAEKSVVEVRQTSDAKVEKIKKDADKFKGKMRNFSSVEKKELTRRVWDLEYKVGKAKYDVIIAQKEAKKLKAAALDHENEIKALEAIHEAEMKTLQQRLTTSEISYDKMRVEDRERMERIVTSFQKRMNRRENKAMSALKGLRNQVMNVFDVKGALTSSADDTFDATTSDLYDVIASVGMDVDTRNKDFGENINSLESILSDTIEGARKDFSDREEEYASNMEKLRKDAVAEREEIIAIKNIEIRKVEQENIRNLGSVRMEFTEKLNKSKGQISRMQNIIDEKDEIIHEYEAEKRSYRKLAGLAWRATKDKVSSRRRDGKK